MRDLESPVLPRGRVSQVGDAAHSMTPCNLLLSQAMKISADVSD